jgi:hypothetical protein
MGSLAAAGAAGIGTGAFTSVEAQRDVDIATTGDASAFLQIEAEDTPNADEYVITEDDDTIALDFTNTNEMGGGGDGLNEDATTIFDNLLKFTNQGTQEIMVGVVNDADGHPGSFYAENSQNDTSDNSSFDVGDWSEDATTIDVGETITNVGYSISDPEDFEDSSFTVTFKAERSGSNQD